MSQSSRHPSPHPKGADDEELSEYLVRVEWIKTLPREQAIWEKGMFANQNTAVRMRDQFTLELLIDRFDLEGGESNRQQEG